MSNLIEKELIAILQYPTATTIQRKQIEQDVALHKMGLFLALLINTRLVYLAKTLANDPLKETEYMEGQKDG